MEASGADGSWQELEDMPPHDLGESEVVDAQAVSESGRVPADRVQFSVEQFRGPLPHPNVLREYDAVVPGLAREIVDQWKGETAHRHETIDALRARIRNRVRLSTEPS